MARYHMNTQPPAEAASPQEQKPQPGGFQVGIGVAVVLGGGAVGSYCGWQLAVPVALALGVGWVLTKVPAGPAAFRNALALVAAQAFWLTADMVLGGEWLPDAAHVLALVSGFTWLWVRPGIGPVILLGLYEVATGVLIAIAIAYGSAQTGSWQHKALVAQLVLRVAVVLFLVSGCVKARKGAATRSQHSAL